eukprot:TRINITY_DN1368_c0_g4_i1.p1 TRINITY_DN1368_c0_g4~~TRINITY_DN1368_c0_g4_i1.p1  ORF type:complete len:538 (+),score=211.84 TRINITY_DN1368_c0_g4_i1:56-1615(+)
MLPPRPLILYSNPVTAESRSILLFFKLFQIPFQHKQLTLISQEDIARLSHLIGDIENAVFPLLEDGPTVVSGNVGIIRYVTNKLRIDPEFVPSDCVSSSKLDTLIEWNKRNISRFTIKMLGRIIDVRAFFTPSMQTRSEKDFDVEKHETLLKRYTRCLGYFEETLLGSQTYLLGDCVTLVDLVFVTEVSFHKVFGVDLEANFPNIAAWFQRIIGVLGAEIWEQTNEEFTRFIEICAEQKRKKTAQQKKMKTHGRDAAGGNKPPDLQHIVAFQQKQPEEIFEILTNSEKLTALMGSNAAFAKKQGGAFSYSDGAVQGFNLFLEDSKTILQSLRFSEWPKESNSTARTFIEKPAQATGTLVRFLLLDLPSNYIRRSEDFFMNFWRSIGGVMTRTIVNQLFFENLSQHDIYDLLTDSSKCARMTKTTCEIGRGVGAEFSYIDGQIKGKNVELVTDSRIVQLWRCDDWTEGHYSNVTIEINRVVGGTEVVLNQTFVPVDQYRQVADLWDKYFWKRLPRGVSGA